MRLQNDNVFILTWAFVPNTVVFLWISAAALAASSPSPPSSNEGLVPPPALADLRDFGAARGLSFVAVSQARPFGLRTNDTELVDVLEGELEQARTALSALEEANASARLRAVEAQLLAHPHLPQAAFLMAECSSLQAQAARATSASQAAALEAQRFALEGPRAAAFGEPATALPVAAAITVDVRGLGSTDELELDGARQAAHVARVSLTPGLHHARVWRGGRVIYASFVQVTGAQESLALDVPALSPCSAEDFAEMRSANHEGKVPPGIACQRWARVRPDGAGIAVSLCERSRCEAFQHWQRQAPTPFAPIAVERRGLPAWAGFALAGGAAVVASSLVLWQAGAFERGRPTAATWEYGGLNPKGIRF